MSRAPVGPSIEVTIRETLTDGSTRHVSRWVHVGPKGWVSADNLGRDHLTHSDETAARMVLAGWLRSQASGYGASSADDAHEAADEADLAMAPTSAELAARAAAEEDDLIG